MLSVVTLGIYWLVWVYPAFKDYVLRAGKASSNSEALFWSYIGSLGAIALFSILFLPLGLIAVVAAIVISGMLVNEVVKDREIAIEKAGGDPSSQSRGLLITLYILTNLFAVTLCGIVIAIPLGIWFYLVFFRGHNDYVRAVTTAQEGQQV